MEIRVNSVNDANIIGNTSTDIQADQKVFLDACSSPRHTIVEVIDGSADASREDALDNSLELCYNLIEEEVDTELLTNLLKLKEMLREGAYSEEVKNQLALVFDDGIDTIYVIMELFNRLDLPFYSGWIEVCNANNSKAVRQADGTYKVMRRPSDGKVQKPEGWEPPKMLEIIQRHYEQRKNSNISSS